MLNLAEYATKIQFPVALKQRLTFIYRILYIDRNAKLVFDWFLKHVLRRQESGL